MRCIIVLLKVDDRFYLVKMLLKNSYLGWAFKNVVQYCRIGLNITFVSKK